MKTLVSLLVVLSCGLRPALGATNDAYGTSGETVIALSGHRSASRAQAGGVTTTMRENVLFPHVFKGMDTNNLNATLLALEKQPVRTNSMPPVGCTALGLVDVAAIPRINRRRESFSDQDKYGGILYKAYRADHPLQLVNPLAPREYGQSETAERPRDRLADVPSGLSVFSIRFK